MPRAVFATEALARNVLEVGPIDETRDRIGFGVS